MKFKSRLNKAIVLEASGRSNGQGTQCNRTRPDSSSECWLPGCVQLAKVHRAGSLQFMHTHICILYISRNITFKGNVRHWGEGSSEGYDPEWQGDQGRGWGGDSALACLRKPGPFSPGPAASPWARGLRCQHHYGKHRRAGKEHGWGASRPETQPTSPLRLRKIKGIPPPLAVKSTGENEPGHLVRATP